MSELVESVAKIELPSKTRYLVLEACVTDSNGEDVELPYLRMKIK
jgi:ubiquitin-activating enzyme E1